MSISRLITMSRLRYPSHRTGILGFEGNGTLQSHFFSLSHILKLAMDWTLGDSPPKILYSPDRNLSTYSFQSYVTVVRMSGAIRPRHTRFTRRGGIKPRESHLVFSIRHLIPHVPQKLECCLCPFHFCLGLRPCAGNPCTRRILRLYFKLLSSDGVKVELHTGVCSFLSRSTVHIIIGVHGYTRTPQCYCTANFLTLAKQCLNNQACSAADRSSGIDTLSKVCPSKT